MTIATNATEIVYICLWGIACFLNKKLFTVWKLAGTRHRAEVGRGLLHTAMKLQSSMEQKSVLLDLLKLLPESQRRTIFCILSPPSRPSSRRFDL